MSLFEPPGPPEPPDEEPAAAAPPPDPPPERSLTETGELAGMFHTEDLPDKPQRVSHRGAVEASPFMQRLLAPVTAVVVVIVVIVLLIWINGGSSSDGQSPAAVGPGPVTTTPAVAPTSHQTAPQSSSPPTPAGTKTLPTTTTTHTAKPTQPSKPTKSAKPAVSTAMAPVTVLNNSRVSGLAASVAAELRSKSWTVTAVGNQTTVIPVTTLYYPPGKHDAALHLAHEFSSVQRVTAAGPAGVSGSGLTLVVTGSWAL